MSYTVVVVVLVLFVICPLAFVAVRVVEELSSHQSTERDIIVFSVVVFLCVMAILVVRSIFFLPSS